jgi:hypothetical protein
VKKYFVGISKIHRKGVLAAEDIRKDEVIFRFTGKVIKNKLIPWHYGRSWLQVGYLEWIIPEAGSAGSCLNHSCDPNAGIRGRNTIVAMRPIRSGEEVTMDYALSDTLPLWHMHCRCGAKNCRKVIKPYQDLSYQRQRKYTDYTAKYIKDMKMHLSWAEYLNHKKKKTKV